jgi:hypothetical protein
MRKLEDGGFIYTLGRQPNTEIKGNYLHDAGGPAHGVYLDEGSDDILVSDLVSYPKGATVMDNSTCWPIRLAGAGLKVDRVYSDNDSFRKLTMTVTNNFMVKDPASDPKAREILQMSGLKPGYEGLMKKYSLDKAATPRVGGAPK